MQRRPFDYARDIECVVAMQHRSVEINFPGESFYEPAFRDSLKRLRQDEIIWVYEDEGQVVGWIWLDLGQGRRRIHVRHLQVIEERWGQGIGRRILEEAIVFCREIERTEMTLNVTKSNARAMALYQSLGFQKVNDWGQGIGRRILEEAIAFCREIERTEVTLNVTKSNARAMALYQSLGFQKVNDWGERQFMRLAVQEAVRKG